MIQPWMGVQSKKNAQELTGSLDFLAPRQDLASCAMINELLCVLHNAEATYDLSCSSLGSHRSPGS